MSTYTFADRYAQSALSPSATIITSRQTSADRIIENVTIAQILDLAAAYYGSPDVNMHWFRDEFAKEDASFSLVNNEREMTVLAALILERLVDQEMPEVILAIVAGHVSGLRSPAEADWLLHATKEALGCLAVTNREPGVVEVKINGTHNPQLKGEIAELAEGDWEGVLAALPKIRSEAQSSDTNVAVKTSEGLKALNREVELLREESQILWWLFSGYSKSLHRNFNALNAPQAALAGAIDLGVLTTASHLGPIAAPAILERVIAAAKKAKGVQSIELATVIDGFSTDDLERLEESSVEPPPRLAPISTAIRLAKNAGPGAWYARFLTETGLHSSIKIEPSALATQLYYEQLLGQLL
ncbi:GTPase-associated system all-helical protein GASH [Pseudomonas sp. R76]|uniref:GTPase-associated system all-helical protein GASH n=1 Tax=Pseudomonas sp. R76 TaxID=1573711 RepID=UPI00131FC9AD|nr:GTPase-associated system all-helical protein GASH [Pseudomonas sp. R76]QHD04240.1 hypothetical protein PspR76_00150 [Pseudomonas sp. R76]